MSRGYKPHGVLCSMCYVVCIPKLSPSSTCTGVGATGQWPPAMLRETALPVASALTGSQPHSQYCCCLQRS